MDVSFVGSGNVMHVLARMVYPSAHSIVQVICRHPEKVKAFASSLNIQSVIGFHEQLAPADIYIVAIADAALPQLYRNFQVSQGMVVHTAGAVALAAIENCGPETGVLYPLQSLRKELDYVPDIPFLIHSNNAESLKKLQSFALSLSPLVTINDDHERKKIHLSAVVSANFINHILALTFDYCKTEGIDPSILQPLLKETIERAAHNHPAILQTGPAIRNDADTMGTHLQMLQTHPELLALYKTLSKSISSYRDEEKDM